MFDAVIFDFDGLILDTETPLYDAWQLTFDHYGVPPISMDEWALSLGRADDDPQLLDPVRRLIELADSALDPTEIQHRRRTHRDRLLARLDLQPGVLALLDEADRVGVPVGLASSSPIDWIERHLGPRDLLGRFATLSCAGAGVPGKPLPDVYLRACTALDIDPQRSLALEDSPHGVTAAKAAGMTCFAVPTTLGSSLDFAHADAVFDSVADVMLHGVAS